MNTKISKTLRTVTMTGVMITSMMGASAIAQTPEAAGCSQIGTPAVTPGMMLDHGSMGHSGMSTPQAMQEVEFDLMYIDMMLPHHQSIIALAEVAQPELTHPGLVDIAEAIIETQDAEIETLMQFRDEWYGDAEPVPMEMMHGMPGMGSDMMAMEQVMSAEWQVQTFCAAENKDLAFIEQTIPHHQMAIDVSEAALEQAVHPELVAMVEDVIAAQQAEIDELEAIRADLTGEATPAA